jgi:hypothetical protein
MPNPIIDPHRELRSPPIDAKPEYAIASEYRVYMEWRRTHREGFVSYLTRDRAQLLVDRGAPKGILHRLEGWETSEARELAERLEA